MERKHHMHDKIKPDDANTEKKTVARPAFSVFPKQYLQCSLKRIGGTPNWFLDCTVSTQI
jgi:hypothetical protein